MASRGVSRVQRSALARMLACSKAYHGLYNTATVIALVVHAIATLPSLRSTDRFHLLVWVESAMSALFCVDFCCRLHTCHERRRFAAHGWLAAKARWMMSSDAQLSLLACAAVVVHTGSAHPLWLTLSRVALCFRALWNGPVRAARRVVTANRQILSTSLALVLLTLALSAMLLYAACSFDPACAKEHQIHSLPSAAFVAAMMLTGQGSPEGENLSPAMRCITSHHITSHHITSHHITSHHTSLASHAVRLARLRPCARLDFLMQSLTYSHRYIEFALPALAVSSCSSSLSYRCLSLQSRPLCSPGASRAYVYAVHAHMHAVTCSCGVLTCG